MTHSEALTKHGYKVNEKLGEGTYGCVYRGFHRPTGRTVALKNIKLSLDQEGAPSLTIREITILRSVKKCTNIVELLDVLFFSGEKGEEYRSDPSLWLVFENCDCDLRNFLKKTGKGGGLSHSMTSGIMYQVIRATNYCHQMRILHRDLKPHNVLISLKSGLCKVADFGLAKSMVTRPRYCTHEIVTLWYRAPEVLLGAKRYGPGVDVWSIGTIMAELSSGRVLLPGDSEVDTIFRIFRMMGTPTEKVWPAVRSFTSFTGREWPSWDQGRGQEYITQRCPEASEAMVEFMLSCFALCPERRRAVLDMMRHVVFASLPPDHYFDAEGFVSPGFTGYEDAVAAFGAAPPPLSGDTILDLPRPMKREPRKRERDEKANPPQLEKVDF